MTMSTEPEGMLRLPPDDMLQLLAVMNRTSTYKSGGPCAERIRRPRFFPMEVALELRDQGLVRAIIHDVDPDTSTVSLKNDVDVEPIGVEDILGIAFDGGPNEGDPSELRWFAIVRPSPYDRPTAGEIPLLRSVGEELSTSTRYVTGGCGGTGSDPDQQRPAPNPDDAYKPPRELHQRGVGIDVDSSRPEQSYRPSSY